MGGAMATAGAGSLCKEDCPELATKSYKSRPPVDDLATLESTTKFTRKELRYLYQNFRKTFPSGYVTLQEFRNNCDVLLTQGDCGEYAAYIFAAFDHNSEDEITFNNFVSRLEFLKGNLEASDQEFVRVLSVVDRGSLEDKLKWIFKIYDINQNDFIETEELYGVIKSLHEMTGMPATDDIVRDHTKMIMRKLDLDSDGIISFDEFMTACKQDAELIQYLMPQPPRKASWPARKYSDGLAL